jgi:hypothetical protein
MEVPTPTKNKKRKKKKNKKNKEKKEEIIEQKVKSKKKDPEMAYLDKILNE